MPHYSLSDISKAVREHRIIYHGRKIQRDISNLGYELADVKGCLLSLTDSDFQKSHDYDGIIYDAYILSYRNPQENDLVDKLYIKLSLIDNRLTVSLASFHLS
jgi:hypothetical protein